VPNVVSPSSVTSGAANLIPEMIRQGLPDSDLKVNELERDHWIVIANVFNDWPFRPTVSLTVPG